MEAATERVQLKRHGALPPGVLRVRSDGKRVYDEAFKAELVRQYLVPGTSVAATGMTHGINANLLRRWIVQHGVRGTARVTPPALLPVTVRAQCTVVAPAPSSHALASPECIEIEFRGARIRLHGPIDAQRLGVVFDVLAQRP